MSKLNLKADALTAYEQALNNSAADWRSVAELLRAAIPTPKAKSNIAVTNGGFAPFADYQITRYKADRVGPTCVVTWGDGEVTRMSVATLPGKPLNVGRGLRVSLAAWQTRTSKPFLGLRNIVLNMQFNSLMNKDRLTAYCQRRLYGRRSSVVSCQFESDGETIATFDPADCNRALAQ